jgi:hypothetical protein
VGDCNSASGGGAGSVGGAGVCAEITDDGSQDVAPAFGGGGGAAKPEALVTTAFLRRRRRRLRLVAGAMVVKGRGVIEQVSETSWIPAAWQTVKRAFKPLSVQRSYRAKKSSLDGAAEGVAGGGGREFLARSPSLTMLDHVGAG